MKTSVPKLHSITWKNGGLARNVVTIRSETNKDIPVDNVIKGAWGAGLKEVVVFGYDANGEEYVASSSGRIEKAAFMFSRGNLFMMRQVD